MYKISLLTVGILLITQVAFAQCYPDRHSTSFQDGWLSCIKSVSPNPNVRPVAHWLKYDLGYTYNLGSSIFWNTNNPEFLDMGLKSVAIDYSLDDENWTELGVFEFEQGSGKSIYEGSEGPDFDGIKARYILITGLESFGTGACMGFSEWKINLKSQTTSVEEIAPDENLIAYPNPFQTSTRVELLESASAIQYFELRDILGRLIYSEKLPAVQSFDISGSSLEGGYYFLRVFDGELWHHEKLIFITTK